MKKGHKLTKAIIFPIFFPIFTAVYATESKHSLNYFEFKLIRSQQKMSNYFKIKLMKVSRQFNIGSFRNGTPAKISIRLHSTANLPEASIILIYFPKCNIQVDKP